MSDAVLMATIAAVVAVVVSFLWIAYHSNMVWDLKLEHQFELERMNAEITGVRDKLRSQEIQARVMGSVPVSRLIANDGG